mmetsp:Transcript_42/g.99  ORF Transcript_42/g.99 Transcript_42/m.99 type:complete len:558 (+) Transcript_42:209-1882(+)
MSASSHSTYDVCLQSLSANLTADEQQTQMLRCISNTIDETRSGVDAFYLIYAASLVFFMQAGFAMVCAGSVRLKNLQNTMLKNLLDACGAALGFYTVGYAFAWGSTDPGANGNDGTNDQLTFAGLSNFFLSDLDRKAFWLFQFSFAATSATIVAGALAERSQMLAYLLYSTMLTAFVYPIVVHSIWTDAGFLSSFTANPLLGIGVIDYAGSLVVHVTGGQTALIAAYVLGARKGRFNEVDGRRIVRDFPGHSIALKMLGVFILWFGWYGFNAGSVYYITIKSNSVLAQNALVNTTLSAAAGCISALLAKAWLSERITGEATFSLTDALWGCLSGLVSVTGGCAVMRSWSSIVVGLISGLIYLWGSSVLVKLRVDDAVDAIPIHLCSGVWGALSVGLFAVPEYLQLLHPGVTAAGWFYNVNDGRLLACQVIGVLFVIGWVTVLMLPFFGLLHYLGWLRADGLDEIVGLDISYHGSSMPVDYNTADDNGSHDQYVAEHRQRRQQQREENQKRGTLRRRMLFLDLSSSKSDHRRPTRQQDGGGNIIGIEEAATEMFYSEN